MIIFAFLKGYSGCNWRMIWGDGRVEAESQLGGCCRRPVNMVVTYRAHQRARSVPVALVRGLRFEGRVRIELSRSGVCKAVFFRTSPVPESLVRLL